MKPFSNFRDIKYLLIVVAAIIAAASLFVSNNFVEKLKLEEKNKMQVWASSIVRQMLLLKVLMLKSKHSEHSLEVLPT